MKRPRGADGPSVDSSFGKLRSLWSYQPGGPENECNRRSTKNTCIPEAHRGISKCIECLKTLPPSITKPMILDPRSLEAISSLPTGASRPAAGLRQGQDHQPLCPGQNSGPQSAHYAAKQLLRRPHHRLLIRCPPHRLVVETVVSLPTRLGRCGGRRSCCCSVQISLTSLLTPDEPSHSVAALVILSNSSLSCLKSSSSI